MIATGMLLFFLVFVPSAFKKTGIKLIIEEQHEGIVLLIMSKILWYLSWTLIALVWVPEYFVIYTWIIVGLAFGISLIVDRKYISPKIQKRSFLSSIKTKANH